MIFINFFNDVASNVNFTPNNFVDFRMRIVACLSSNVDFGIAFLDDNTYTNKISICNRPYSFILLIVDFKDIFLLIQYFHFNYLRVHFC